MFDNIKPKENLSPEDGYGAIDEIASDESTPFVVVKDIEERFKNRKSTMTAVFLFVAVIGVFAMTTFVGKKQTENPAASISAAGLTGCDINYMDITIYNYLDVALVPDTYNIQDGNINVSPCPTYSDSSGSYTTNCGWYINKFDVTAPSSTFSAGTTDACSGVQGTLTLKPDDASYISESGLQSIEVYYQDGGGPNGDLSFYLQYITTPGVTAYPVGEVYPFSTSCSNSKNCQVWFNIEAPFTAAPTVLTEYTSYEGKWNWIASDGSTSLTSSISWDNESSQTTGKSFEQGYCEGASAGFGDNEVSVSASQTFSTQSSNTISSMSGGETSATCSSTSMCGGKLYQWQLVGTPSFGPQQSVTSCQFKCVPDKVQGGPRCPLGYCENNCCQCCNDAWIVDTTVSDPSNYVSTEYGGSCSFDCPQA